ncbi:bifunctional precorrin-2 dehydrogenase/sirohydrochlorin ferrochelatase [Halobacteria archaeon AArc-m2/3/4]|uniref:precorrin-2 dehydrogenase n=1 Tax=Natronoglomus mannanivorans TaxID=2979990 RepID=A0AAP3E3C4_9EURY|nr:bifunctional precorrin-2 dehydrogenase/sirohydrochlorin ferrochelatase [Halobacteria archaeon AArc-xg1-1]MCU4974729.1 bifunctional precorrin-2 dehydrogenase/sirohydrochlorin ferrochelatase [Halobacteria archaeon AArc-m2/3/4]
MIPLLHDFSNETVLVVGGGPVGARKARRFAREARVVVVSPEFADVDFGDAELIRAAPEPEETDDWLERFTPALVVAATDDEEVNDAVVAAARDRGVLVNRADRAGDLERDHRDVVVPATVREDPVIVAISTGATAPALSKYLRQELEETLAGAGEMATAVSAVREELKDRDVPPDRRRKIVTDLVNSPAHWTTLRTGPSNSRQVIEDVFAPDGSLATDPNESNPGETE